MNKFIIKLDKFQQQVILASKGNSKLNDNFDKIFIIRNIIARYYRLRIKYISDKSVLKYLEELCEEIIKQNSQNGVKNAVVAGYSVDSSIKAIEIIKSHKNLYATVRNISK